MNSDIPASTAPPATTPPDETAGASPLDPPVTAATPTAKRTLAIVRRPAVTPTPAATPEAARSPPVRVPTPTSVMSTGSSSSASSVSSAFPSDGSDDLSSYKKLSDVEHILLRPAIFIGEMGVQTGEVWLLDVETLKAYRQVVDHLPPLEQLAMEVATNATDNVSRSREKGIAPGRIEQTMTERVVTVYNEGAGIPVALHPEEGVYVPQMVFFMLRTSSNYNDNEERKWVGMNGLGVKLVAVFSHWMTIEVADPGRQLLYTQRCEKNLSVVHPPVITPYHGATAYTRVSYEADFERFGVTGYTPEMVRMFAFHAASASFTTKVPLTFNGALFDFAALERYVTLFVRPEDKTNHLIYKDDAVELCLLDTPEKGFHVSFVSGLYTRRGGVHVNETLKLFSAAALEKLNKKSKLFDVSDVKRHLSLIISCTLVNPVFTTQTKDCLTRPTPRLNVPAKTLRAIEKWNFATQLALYADVKLHGGAPKEKKRRETHVVVPGAVQANDAGGPNSHKCVLILTEGESAKTFAVRYRGCFPDGPDRIGIKPMRGKGLNVRNATGVQVMDNPELTSIRRMIGLRAGVDYSKPENRAELRYGKVIYATDADVDGDHIKGLGLNLFDVSYPSLAREGFLGGLLTPLFRAVKGQAKNAPRHYFMTQAEFDEWYGALADAERKKWEITYYKGLGRWEPEDFADASKFIEVDYQFTDTARAALALAFDKDHADTRKAWVANPTPPPSLYTPHSDGRLTQEVDNFVHAVLVKFSQASNDRAIPSVIDNFKPSQRKIFFATRLSKLGQKPMKIAQFAGFVAERTEYAHGEGNVVQTIMNMCQHYPGANNIPLLTGKGEYGTRMANGKDAADGRYVFMTKQPLTDYIFRTEDDPLLEYLVVDGEQVEPRHYYPIICMTAVNGASGIGTGFSTKCPPRNPLEVLAFQRAWLHNHHPPARRGGTGASIEDAGALPCSLQKRDYPGLLPWYRDFTGVIERSVRDYRCYTSRGVLERGATRATRNGDTTQSVRITELPIGTATNDYIAHLDSLVTEKKIASYRTQARRPEVVDFQLLGVTDASYKALRLETVMSDTNIVLYDDNGFIAEYRNIGSVLDNFCQHRYRMYEKRITVRRTALEKELAAERAKVAFITDVLNGTLVLNNPDIEDMMRERDYPLSLLDIPVRSLTEDGLRRRQRDISKLENELRAVADTIPSAVWLKEMDEFEREWRKYYGLPALQKPQLRIAARG